MERHSKSPCELPAAQKNENDGLPQEDLDAVEDDKDIPVKRETSPSSDDARIGLMEYAPFPAHLSQASSSHGIGRGTMKQEQIKQEPTFQEQNDLASTRHYHYGGPMLDRMGDHGNPWPVPQSHGDASVAMHPPPPDSSNLNPATQGAVGHSDITDIYSLAISQQNRAYNLMHSTSAYQDQNLLELGKKVFLTIVDNENYLTPANFDRARFQIFDAQMNDLENQIKARIEQVKRAEALGRTRLDDFQMQLRLLEQQNRRRLGLSRQRQEEKEYARKHKRRSARLSAKANAPL
ncbi:hypothetical protein F5B22DRAFT_647390 [Xylaria bambusicola]|uniref:uncharacterized protein n=1 Tax=Xylaria bambusicola TaxID=326684 RepID=UPI002008DAA1|nr:uncharacterized protein F5B22DRAFT_647390 [Xylaria bambusicola]KAI0514635.1 hypothetical protein F5B22DRAFT_647390 [Xylaria bambusicola]